MGGKSSNKGPGSGRPKNPPKPKKMLKEVIPTAELFSPDELEMYNSLVDVYMADFSDDDLSASDTDDIMVLCMNKIFEIRLLKTSKEDPDRQIDIAATIEKLRKQNEKIKENLVSRRKDRIDPHKYKGFSIVDLAVKYDNDRKFSMEEKARSLRKKNKKAMEDLDKHKGNRYDLDGDMNKDNA